MLSSSFFFNDTATTEIYTLSLHDALPICLLEPEAAVHVRTDLARLIEGDECLKLWAQDFVALYEAGQDRKSTRLNSSHQIISYAVFCLKKKNNHETQKHQAHVYSQTTGEN